MCALLLRSIVEPKILLFVLLTEQQSWKNTVVLNMSITNPIPSCVVVQGRAQQIRNGSVHHNTTPDNNENSVTLAMQRITLMGPGYVETF